jgi:hypothetical protein
VLLVVALVLGVALVAANTLATHRELDALLTRVVDAQAEVAYSNHRIAATVDYTLPLLFRAALEPRVRAGLQQLVEDSAAGQVDGVRQQRDQAARTGVLPWHHDVRLARAALVRYLDARVAYVKSVAADQETLFVEHPDLDRLLAAARQAFARAAGPAGRHRIDVAFAGGTHPS